MTKILKTTIALALLLASIPVTAGEITPGVAAQMQGLSDDDVLKVLVVLRDQVDVETLDRELHAAKSGMNNRHNTVVSALKDMAAASQEDLLATLARKSSTGVRGYAAHWLINAVVVTADVATIRDLADRPDVERIEPDLVYELVEPIGDFVPKSGGPAKDAAPPSPAVPDGIGSIRAHEVWYSLGFDGTGVIVGGLDTGVDGTHPALADKWRGADPGVLAGEAWFVSDNFGDPKFPSDEHGHGTHTMGTMLGSTVDDTVGVAPGATWIASNCIYNYEDDFDNDILRSLEFFADPDGDPGTSDDVPAVVNNSWGLVTPDTSRGYIPCDSRYWAAIDNCEAAGIVMVWGAGNEGPGAGSLRMPADRASTATNCFSVGSVSRLAPFSVSSFSSRGPSLCGGPYEIKPEVSAPGSAIYSSWPGGVFGYLSGTSMASPHVAGTVALMRQANPDADVTTIKEVLMATARDILDPGEDNDSGWGVIDAYAAVLAILPHTGTVSGVVTDGGTGLPLEGVVVARVGGLETFLTGPDGAFSFFLPSGAHDFTAKKFGYGDGLVSVTILDDMVVSGDMAISAMPPATVSGTITDPDGLPVADATVQAAGTPLAEVTSDGTGFYSIVVPTHPTTPYNFRVSADDLGVLYQEALVTGDLTLDFQLPIDTTEDFETNHLYSYPWYDLSTPPTGPWHTVSGGVEGGNYCVRSGATPNYFSSILAIDWDVAQAGDISFWVRISSEENFDFLHFLIDDVIVASWSGLGEWERFHHPVSAGPHTFKWEYAKDGSAYYYEDAAFVDFITFPEPVIPPAPVAFVNTADISLNMAPGGTGAVGVNVFNTGAAGLEFKARMLAVDDASKAAGVDPFGYVWSDSDEPGGPAYGWIDISGDGTDAGVADDALLGPFDLGFTMPFYAADYDSIYIGTNGFLSFTGDTHDYRNGLIPDPDVPNGMLAFFWDNLRSNEGGTIYYRSEPSSGRFIVQFQDVVRYYTRTPHTMQVILNENGDIVYQYADVPEPVGATVGIENATGTVGVQVAYNDAAYPYDGLAIRFDYPGVVDWATVVPDTGVVAPEDNLPLTVEFDATGLPEGVHTAELAIFSNDPVTPVYRVPVNLNVSSLSGAGDLPTAQELVFHGAVPNPFNPTTDLKFSLPREATVSLRIYDVAGRRVRDLLTARLPAGPHAVRWDGRDDGGSGVASGVFFARLVVDTEVRVERMTLVR